LNLRPSGYEPDDGPGERVNLPRRCVEAPQGSQPNAIARATHTSRIRASLSVPSRFVSVPTPTFSTLSRLTDDLFGMGSSPTSSTTSVGSPRMFVVHGATRVLLRRGIATSLVITTTGRRGISGSSHHQTSPWAGRFIMMMTLHHGRRRDRPIRRELRSVDHRMPCSWHRSPRPCIGRAARREPHRSVRRR
jgi:hypothetical protein